MDELSRGPFRVGDALAADRSRSSIDSRHYEMPFHGIRSPLGVSDLWTQCRAYALRMRSDAAFTSVTAADLWGMPLPVSTKTTRLHVSVPFGRPRPRSRGVVGSERDPDVATADRGGLRLLSPAATWASLATFLGIADLIAVGDFILGDGRRPALASLDDLAAVASRRTRGAPRLRRALPHIRLGSASRPESLSRILFVASGIPEPRLNYVLPGLRFAIDLAWPEARFGYEYQGKHHAAAAQRTADVQRQELVHDEGWLLMEATKIDLFDAPLATVERVRRRLDERGVRSRRTNPPIWALPRR